jgi:hypothetical protein
MNWKLKSVKKLKSYRELNWSQQNQVPQKAGFFISNSFKIGKGGIVFGLFGHFLSNRQ